MESGAKSMQCKCGAELDVLRTTKQKTGVRRRRVCPSCQLRYSTFESFIDESAEELNEFKVGQRYIVTERTEDEPWRVGEIVTVKMIPVGQSLAFYTEEYPNDIMGMFDVKPFKPRKGKK
jgi:transcription repressor NrdR-like protein